MRSFLFILSLALFALVSLANAAPLTASELSVRAAKLEALVQKNGGKVEKRNPLLLKTKLALEELIALKARRESKLDNNPHDCGIGRIVCPVSYNGIGHPICDFGHCKLKCPRGLKMILSHANPEFPSFCA
ncbi:uncharacterized protein JCM15063_006459 [Sporobolomyces koalae]|uniref:uncharacterized protein n=1 Tax=Sporobolomyces koalae TaxID=500713 RepID=UPI00317E06E6